MALRQRQAGGKHSVIGPRVHEAGVFNTFWLLRLVRLEQSRGQVETDPVTNLKFDYRSIDLSIHRSRYRQR